ncbi:hypothetical protein AALO_G00271550 [Alosa alosa]|uniref:Uncharacterized protein n=1 Tax=Alosa alosa TaxID=278164 RepID=A0AAV6FQR4_9TELE|nr:hypothetical protein AALO_G00271550 [Alosa alosa]
MENSQAAVAHWLALWTYNRRVADSSPDQWAVAEVPETLLECLRNKFKKERSPLINLTTVQEIKRKFGVRRQRIVDHVPLEDPPGHQRAKKYRVGVQMSSDYEPTQEIMLDLEAVGEDYHLLTGQLCRRQPDISHIMDRMRQTVYKRVE